MSKKAKMYIRWFAFSLIRILAFIINPIVLLIPTIYAQAKGLNRLPWGLDKYFGCQEDGWNGNGIDPDNPRQGWQESIQGVWVEEKDRKAHLNYQGWWPDYLGVRWSELGSFKQWWLGFRWCAWRNQNWNLRLTKFGANIHYDNVLIIDMEDDGDGNQYYYWKSKDNNKHYFFYKKKGIEVGWEFYPNLIHEGHKEHKRVSQHGYTRGYKYLKYSIVSNRLRS